MRLKFPVSLLVLFSLWTGFLTPFISAQRNVNQTQNAAYGLQFRLSEAPKRAEKPQKPEPVSIENLSDAEAAEIFARLPPLPVETGENSGFNTRSETQKPPKTGNVVPVKFPSDEKRKAPKVKVEITTQNLEIESYSPTGNVPLVADLTVKFSQPMIAVSSQTEASETVPVEMKPEVKGKWRWLGTDTLLFDAEQRFPMATTFTVTIPKGVKSETGATLAKDFSWKFTTPPATIEKFFPSKDSGEIFPEYAIMTAKFNQEIDERDVFSKISVFVGEKKVPVRLITSEVDESFEAYQRLGEVKPKHWLAFRTVELLPLNTEVKVVFEKGLPSAEGAAKTSAEQIFTFRTLSPFKLAEIYCGYQSNPTSCEPSNDFRLRFNRSLAPGKFNASLVKIEPAIEGAKIETDGSMSSIYIKGNKKPNTRYKVTLSGEAIDFYNIKVGTDISAEFNVGTEQTQFFALGGDFVTLDPNAKPVFSIYSKNHASFKFKLYATTPADYPAFRQLLRDYYNNRMIMPIPTFGKQIFNKTVEIKSEIDALTETRIDLSEAFANNLGHAVLVAEPTVRNTRYDYRDMPLVAWIQSTNIGIDAAADYEKLFAYVSDLKTGKPLPRAEVSLLYDKFEKLDAVADDRGSAEFTLISGSGHGFLVAKNGADSAILREPQDYYGGGTGFRKQTPYEQRRWFVFDDRKMYRPQEEVSVKGYLRKITGGKFTDIAAIGDAVKLVTYIARDPRNNEIARGAAALNAFGAFDLKIKLPAGANLGYHRLQFWTSENTSAYPEFEHSYQVQEFRRPEFEVTVEAETPAPYFVGNSAVLSAEAKYFTGGALANSALRWAVSAAQTTYSPPNHESFTFGAFVPWWRRETGPSVRYSPYGLTPQSLTGTTDADGKHRVNLDLIAANPARPYTLRAAAETDDVNRQTIADTKNFLVHPAEIYVGLRAPKTFVRQGEPLVIEAVAADIDGKRVAGAPIEIVAVLKDWQRSNGWQEIVVDTQTCKLTSTADASSCRFNVKQGGRISITATVLDAKERPNTSELQIWAAGGNTPPKRGIELEKAELIPDKKEYAPGDTAEILVNAPFYPAEGVMTVERGGIIKTERFTMNEASHVLQIPVEERFLPNFHVKVALVGAVERTNNGGEIDSSLPKRPAFADGEINLKVSTASRRLSVSVEPLEKVTEPGKEAKINIDVKDNLGNPVAESEVAVIAVDEGALSLTGYKIPNPLDAFYQQIAPNVQHHRSREEVVLGNPTDNQNAQMIENLPVNERSFTSLLSVNPKITASKSKKSELADGVYNDWDKNEVAYIVTGESEKSAINIRRNFDALAIYAPSVKTDANGKATVAVKLPDNVTRYRITAVAVTKSKQFGQGESNLTARQDLMIRPSAPRFMNFGDKAELPVVLQNQSNQSLTVNVAVRGANARLLKGNGRKVTIPAGERAEIRFPVSVETAGIARFQVGALSGNLTDAAEFAFPVYTPATSEAFATYGTTDESGAIVQSIAAPDDVFPQFGGLEITTSSTQLQELTDAFIYLQQYPFGCTEQTSSRLLAISVLRDAARAFNSKDMPSDEELERRMLLGIERLGQLQHSDGGFSFWRGDDASVPYVSVHVAHAIARAKLKGYKVSGEMLRKSLDYLKNIETKYPAEYSEESKRAISAYALYVRNLLGDRDVAKAKSLVADAGIANLSAESLGWLLSVLADEKAAAEEFAAIRQNLLNRVSETAGAAHFVTKYKDGEYVLLASNMRADAVILEALLKIEPEHPLIPKIVRGLLAARVKGYWQNTQENAFILVALDKYFEVYEKTTPDFTAKIWLGDAFAGEQKFAGRTVDSNLVSVSMSQLQQAGKKQNLTMDKQGAGRLYYRIGMKYAPKNLNLAAADYGFALTRTYEAIDNPQDVKQNSDNSWTIRAGARVRVRVQMVAPTRRYHVALVDNLPAGFEIINSQLATTGSQYVSETPEMRRRSNWFQHENFRDNRAEAFTSLLTEGVWNYSYLARATTPGTFIVPPAKAEEMYMPETFGRTRTHYVKVE